MNLMDSHLHLEGLNNESLQQMAMCGIRAIVGMVSIPEVVPEMNSDFPPEAIFEYADRVLDFHGWVTREHFLIETYLCVCVSMVGVPRRYNEALAGLREYVSKRERVVGIGEIGFEPGSPTCSDMRVQEELINAQLEIAKEVGTVLCFHTPLHEKPSWTERYLGMLKESGVDPAKVIIDHADSTNVRLITDAGYIAGVTVQPHRHVRANEAAEIIRKEDSSRILINSDTATLNESDPLAVARVALELRKFGMDEGDIEKVLWQNPRRVYRITQ